MGNGRSRDDLIAEIAALVARVEIDDQAIATLQAQAMIDRELIAHLQAEGLLQAEHVEQLEAALVSSRRIGAAVGVIMALRKVPAPEAFDVLRAASQNTNRKLHDVAEAVLLTGLTTD